MSRALSESTSEVLQSRLLAMADDELLLAHRNSEWTGHAPILEEDIAFSNIAQDELGHAGIWYEMRWRLGGQEPDKLVFLRNESDFRNIQLVELPKGDWAFSMLRQYLFDAFEMVQLASLAESSYRPLAEAAAKIRPEEMYHYRHTSTWVQRLGLGTEESNRRSQEALDAIWPFTGQLFQQLPGEEELVEEGWIPDPDRSKERWLEVVVPFLRNSGLASPEMASDQVIGRDSHTEYLAEMLAELQEVARLDPEATW